MLIADDFDGACLLDSATHATCWDGLLFVPVALWTPEGWGDGVLTEPLARYSTAYLPTGSQQDGTNWLEYQNALWVRARLPTALGFAPPTCRHAVRSQLLDVGLLAVSVGECGPRITPFVCDDRDGWLQAELRFGPSCPADRRRVVAAAFWGLLTSAPAALANYRDRLVCDYSEDSHTAAGYWRGQFHLWDRRGML